LEDYESIHKETVDNFEIHKEAGIEGNEETQYTDTGIIENEDIWKETTIKGSEDMNTQTE